METTGTMTGIFLQVRLDSARLPRKALLPLPGGTVIQHAMASLKQVKADVYALLTDEESSHSLKVLARNEGFEVFVGPKEDVLKRYRLGADHFNTDLVIRATGDNPLVSPCMAQRIIRAHSEKGSQLSHYTGLPIGAGIEVVSKEALVRADEAARDPFEREHLTTYMYRNSKEFILHEPGAPEEFFYPDLKISIDTREDYDFILKVYEELYEGVPIETDRVIQWHKSLGA